MHHANIQCLQPGLCNPETLEEGERYFVINAESGRITWQWVTFVSHTSCPGVVVIANRCGIKSRCLRDELFGPSKAPRSAANDAVRR